MRASDARLPGLDERTQPQPLQERGPDNLRLSCTWDNPTDDDIDWGDGTGDEMCLGTMLMSLQ